MKKTLQEEKQRILDITKRIQEQNLYADGYEAQRDLEGEQRGEYNQIMNKAIIDYMQYQKGKGIPLKEIEEDIIQFVKEQTSLLWDEGDEPNDMNSSGREYGKSLRYRDDGGTEGG